MTFTLNLLIYWVWNASKFTTNVTGVTKVWSASTGVACAQVTPPGESYYNTLLCCNDVLSSSVVSRAFSALCMYLKFRHHPHSLGYFCAKSYFLHGLHCWASPGEKSSTQSVNHSITQLIWCPGSELIFIYLLTARKQKQLKQYSKTAEQDRKAQTCTNRCLNRAKCIQRHTTDIGQLSTLKICTTLMFSDGDDMSLKTITHADVNTRQSAIVH